LQSKSLRLERELRDWAQGRVQALDALYEKHNKGKEVDSRARQQLSTAARKTTSEWSHDQCTGKAAVLIMRQLTIFSGQSLGLAYGLLESKHFNLQHDAVIQNLVKACIENSSESEVQLADLFASLVDKQSELTELADKEYKSIRHKKEEQTKAAEHRELMNKLVTRTAPQQQQQPQHQQYSRAHVGAKPPRGTVEGCR